MASFLLLLLLLLSYFLYIIFILGDQFECFTISNGSHFPLMTTRWRHEVNYRDRPVVDAARGRALGPLGVWGIAVSRLSSGAARCSESFR